ncbi:hypothetical protein CEP54_016251 [Fusarium duplospermum]|uniref:Uncharacterized protein n=1 Tax=Fusarium duplospermum TaxID=1325734 RepID=A0A428NGJ0_9HYPO|nr:hypothetical protein CEP54_016251 [Fusarium duplospermum]
MGKLPEIPRILHSKPPHRRKRTDDIAFAPWRWKRQRREEESHLGQISFGLGLEFACYAGDDIQPPDGAAAATRHAYKGEQEAVQCDRLYDTLAKAYQDYAFCGIPGEAPPRHEVYSLGSRHEGDDIHVPGHIRDTPFPRYYSSWGFRYESSCEAATSGGEGRMRPYKLNSPVLDEREWRDGFPTVSRVLDTILQVTDGRVGLGCSYGTHVNISFGSWPGETCDDRLRTLKRLLTLLWILEEHIFGLTCPDREGDCGFHLSTARDWPGSTKAGEAETSTTSDVMDDNLPAQLIAERACEMKLI